MASIYKRKEDRKRKDKPWMISYTDENCQRQTITGSTDKGVTEEIARAKEAEVCRRKHGLSNAIDDRYHQHGTRTAEEHFKEYIQHCNHIGMSADTIALKESHVNSVLDYTGGVRLIDIEPNSVEAFLRTLRDNNKSARTINHYRADIVAFLNWCVKTGRLRHNPLSIIPKLNEDEDRRRIRRALTQEELSWLLAIAVEQDKNNKNRFTHRYPIYLTAAMTGLRRSELEQLTWSDIDLENLAIRVRVEVSKAKREDWIPLHKQVSETLLRIRPENPDPNSKVFETVPKILTFYKDLARARAKWISQAQNDTQLKQREKSDFLKQIDSQGRVIDMHAMRTTLGTNLALQGVTPQLAQKIMRHSDYKTTLAHYTVLGLVDTNKAVNTLPAITPAIAKAKESITAPDTARKRQNPASTGAKVQQHCEAVRVKDSVESRMQVIENAPVSNDLRHHAPSRNKKAGDGNRTHVTSLEGWSFTIKLHPQKCLIIPKQPILPTEFSPLTKNAPPPL